MYISVYIYDEEQLAIPWALPVTGLNCGGHNIVPS